MSLVRNLHLDYGDFKIAIDRLEIKDKGVTALWGPSGSGKSSVLRALLGLEECPQLQWKFKDQDLAKLKPGDRKIGVVFQSYELFPHMTALGNIEFGAHARGVLGDDFNNRLSELDKTLNIQSLLNKKVAVLSGGEKQRVALMRALIGKPQLLFLDEPFSALDSALKIEARKLVKTIIKKENIPTLLITHDKEDVADLSAFEVHILDGKIIS